MVVKNRNLILRTAAIISASGMSLEASLLYGALLGTCGLFFAGLTVFIAQLADTARNTTMLSIGLVIVLYLIRAIGDVGNEMLALISPLGWVVPYASLCNKHLVAGYQFACWSRSVVDSGSLSEP